MAAQERTTHIIGAGLAGLSAATYLAEHNERVVLYDAAPQAGGRCRSFHDSTLGMVIDNGTHLLLSGNHAALSYLRRIGSDDAFVAQEAVFPFVDAQNGRHISLQFNRKSWPLLLMRYPRLGSALLLAALNTRPQEASRRLVASVLQKTLLKGSAACVPLLATGLSAAFIDPALRYLSGRRTPLLLNCRLRHIELFDTQVAALHFTHGKIALKPQDRVICALPPWNMGSLLPDLRMPGRWNAIVNAYFRIAPPAGFPAMLGVLRATAQWVFGFRDHIAVTVSDAGRLMQESREALAQRLWQDVMKVTKLEAPLPTWQIIREKRATFAATREEDAKRPGNATAWRNLYLAGDWIQTGLPATLESAIVSGHGAADMVMINQ